jgi:hypothetical protein
VLALVWLVGLAYLYMVVVYPVIEWITAPRGGFFTRKALKPLRALAASADRFAREQLAALNRWIAANQRPATIVLLQFADVTNRVAGTLGDMAEQTHAALWTLNHETIPRKIQAALIPLRNQLDRHTDRLDELEDLNRRVAVEVGDTLRALPWGVPGGYVTNIATFLGRFVQLWEHYWNTTRTQLNTLLADTIPELRRDIADLARRLDVQIDARFDALGNRISDLERWRENVVMPRIEALTEAVDALSEQIFDPVVGGLVALLERVGELERQLREDVAERIAELERGLAELRTDLEEGVRTGLEAFRERIEALELQAFTQLPQQIAAMQLAIDAIAAEVFDEVGAGLALLTARIVELEQWVFGQLGPKIDLALGRIEAIEAQIRDDFLPRLRAIEDILAPAAFAAFVLAALRVSAPYLFCRNVVTAATEACAAPADLIDDLLLAAFFLIGGISIVELARELQGITGFVAGAVDEWIVEN